MSEYIIFEDAQFEEIVRKKVGIYDRPLKPDDVKNIKSIYVNARDYNGNQIIQSIKGIEFLTGLEDIRIYGFKPDNGIQAFKNSHGLKVLIANECGLTSTSGVENFKDIEAIHLRGNDIENADELRQCNKLTEIDLSNNKLESLTFCENLNTLEYIYADNNSLQSLRGLENSTTLKEIRVSQNKLNTLSEISKNTQLEILEAGDNNISSIDDLQQSIKIRILRLPNNPNLASINVVGNMFDLKTLDVSYNKKISDFGDIKSISKLENLYVRECGLKDMEFLKNTRTLKSLDISNNLDLNTANDLDYIVENNPLDYLYYYGTGIEERLKSSIVDFEDDQFKDYIKKELYISPNNEITENQTRYKFELSLNKPRKLSGITKFKNLKEVTINKSEDIKYAHDNLLHLSEMKSLNKIKVSKQNINVDEAEKLIDTGIKNKISVYYENNFDCYNLDQFVQVEKSIKNIIDGIDANWSELEKTRYIYEKLGRLIFYDNSGNLSSYSREEANTPEIQEKVARVRNLYGTLVEGKGVCSGYAKTMCEVLGRVGIEAKYISGDVPTVEQSNHAWNAVKIDNQWYYCDLTWDAKKIRENKALTYFCISENNLKQDHTLGSYQEIPQCSQDMSVSEIIKAEITVGIRQKPKDKNPNEHEKIIEGLELMNSGTRDLRQREI